MNNRIFKYTILSIAALAALSSCEKSASEVYENKVFLDNYVSSKTLYISIENSYTETLVAAIPKPAESPLKVVISPDAAQLDYYNDKFGTEAVMLPEANYSFSANEFTISEGGVRSGDCVISFKDVLSLDKKTLYVLPVSLKSDDIAVLDSRDTKFFVFEGANLINDAAYMWDNYCDVTWNHPEPVSNLQQLTIEMLLNCDWDKNKNERKENNSFFGIEGYFLFRTGDLANANNRLQICTNSGEPLLGYMPYNEWFNLIVTYDASTRSLVMYVNGEQVGSSTAGNYSDGVTFATDQSDDIKKLFHVNTAYNPIRNAGAIFSEVRIWNRILDADTIKDQETHPYFVDPASEGLVAYWKFNEGSGQVIADRSGNGNDLKAAKPVEWRKVALPEAE